MISLEERFNRRLLVEFRPSDDCEIRQQDDDLWVATFAVGDRRNDAQHEFEVFFYRKLEQQGPFELWKIKFGPKTGIGDPRGGVRDYAWLAHMAWNKVAKLWSGGAEVSGREIFSKVGCAIKRFLETKRPDALGFSSLYKEIGETFDRIMGSPRVQELLTSVGYRAERIDFGTWGLLALISISDLSRLPLYWICHPRSA